MTELLQITVSGLSQGALYGLMALGLTVVYRASTVLNFMHGQNFMVAALVAYFAITFWNLPYVVAIILALAAVFVLGLIIDRIAYRPLLNAPHLTQVFATIAISFMLIGSARMFIGDERPMPPILGGAFWDIAGARVNPQHLITAAVLLVTAVLFAWVFRRTHIGLILRASTQSPRGAALVGIDVRRITAMMWGVGGVLGGMAGILAAPFLLVNADMGIRPLILGFAAMTLGGFGTFPGAVIGGLIVGLTEVGAGFYISTRLGDAAGFALILIVLLLRPGGLFGIREP
jgi:branched-chain amino acid transport system permease protein